MDNINLKNLEQDCKFTISEEEEIYILAKFKTMLQDAKVLEKFIDN